MRSFRPRTSIIITDRNRCINTHRILVTFLTLWDCIRVLLCMSGTEWQCDSLGTGWPPSGLFPCCWINAPGSVNIDKCALQERLLPCSSPMPQTNEFLKTASIKPQARSIDHRVDFISAAERCFGTNIASTWMSCQAAFHLYQASCCLQLAGTVNQEQSNKIWRQVCPVTECD